ncbi:MAG: tetratricopeptide repeat protein, partial [Bradymonadia bacterium]
STVLTSETVVQALSKTEEFAAASESVSARIERLENALGLDPTRQEAYEELADLYRSERRYEELASVLERHSTIVTDEQMRAELLLERAGIAQDHLRDQQLARRIWERVIDLDAADLSSTRFALISFLGTNPRRVGLERLLEKLNRRIEESASAKRAGLLSLRAELWHRHLGETNRARADLEAAIAADEFNTVALFALARIAMGRGELTDASAWVRDALHAPGAEQQVTVVRQILGELRSAFVKQDEYGEWLSYLSSIQSEHQDASMASVISDMVRDEND